MIKEEYKFSTKNVAYYFDTAFVEIEKIVDKNNVIILTDENVYNFHKQKFAGYKIIVIKAGEQYKHQQTIDKIINELINYEADRKTILIGIGGGVVTDITGYAASVFLRGIAFAFVPTTILAMVDACIGGKNGIDVGLYKNLIGTINQPNFLIYDYSFLETLPNEQWINGFAEIIKHSCINDLTLFEELELNTLEKYKTNYNELALLIKKNVLLKTAVVIDDEFEQGDRKLLNFGHTFGHAIENLYQLPHGSAVSIGMVLAAKISEEINNFYSSEKQRLVNLLTQYHLPTQLSVDKENVFSILTKDKKRVGDTMNFILLNKIGKAVIQPIPLTQLNDLMHQIL